jgi:hypothetical protein
MELAARLSDSAPLSTVQATIWIRALNVEIPLSLGWSCREQIGPHQQEQQQNECNRRGPQLLASILE